MPASPIIRNFDSNFVAEVGNIGSTPRTNVVKINGVFNRPKCFEVDTTIAGTSGVGNLELRNSGLNTASVIVDWGDGTNDTMGSNVTLNHTYPSAGTYDVTVYGSYTHTSFGQAGYGAEGAKWKDIFTWQWFSGAVGYGAFSSTTPSSSGFSASDAPADPPVGAVTVWFSSLPITRGLLNWDVSQITNWDRFLASCPNFNEAIGIWDVTGTSDFDRMLSGCTSFDQSVQDWDVSGVSAFTSLFDGATSYNQPMRWQMPTTPFSMTKTFRNADSFNQDIGYDTGGDGAWNMAACTSLVETFEANGAFNTSIENWNTSNVVNLSGCFESAVYSAGLNGWDVSSVKNFSRTFFFSSSINDLDQWDPSAGTDFTNMFLANGTATRNIGAWAIGTNLQAGETVNMAGCFKAVGGINPDVSNWDASKVTNLNTAFERCSQFTGVGVSTWNTSNCADFRGLFQQCANFNQNVGNFTFNGVTQGTYIEGMFDRCGTFNSGATSGTSNTNLNWTLPSTITSLGALFKECTNFNCDVRYDAVNGYWDTSNITSLSQTFQNCQSFNQDISNWDVSSVTNFSSCFNNGNLNPAMIFNAPLGSWTVSAGTNFNRMFYSQSTRSWTQSLTGWVTTNMQNINSMFYATAFDQDISGWNITNLTDAGTFLANNNGAFSTANYDAILDSTTGWPSQSTPQSGVTWGMGTTQYTAGGNAEAGRNILTGTYGWTITDGGPV
jgi:surface protein